MSSIDWDYIAALAGDAHMTPAYQERMCREMAVQEPPVACDGRKPAPRVAWPTALTRLAHAPGKGR